MSLKEKIAVLNLKVAELKETNSSFVGLNKRESNYQAFEDAFQKLLSAGTSKTLENQVNSSKGLIVQLDKRVIALESSVKEVSENVEEVTNAVIYLVENVQNNSKNLSDTNAEFNKLSYELGLFYERAIELGNDQSAPTYSTKYDMALPLSKSKEICNIQTGESIFTFPDNNGAVKECICPDAYEVFYNYDSDNLYYTGCVLKTAQCSGESDGQTLFRGPDGICYSEVEA